MGTRYIWRKYNYTYHDGGSQAISNFSQSSYWTKRGYCYTGYTINSDGRYQGLGSYRQMPDDAFLNPSTNSSARFAGVDAATYPYYFPGAASTSDIILVATTQFAQSGSTLIWGAPGNDTAYSPATSTDIILKDTTNTKQIGSSVYPTNVRFYKYDKPQAVSTGSILGYVSSNSSTAYPSYGVYGGFLYSYTAEDDIDTTAISYPTTVTPNSSITITTTAPSISSNGYGIVSYEYQYSLNGSSTWNAIQTTTNKSISYNIPSSTKNIRFRVRAVDNYGYVAAQWTTGLTATAPQYTISISASPTEGGTVSGAGTYTQGTSVTVKATPKDGWEFVNWTEGTTVVSKSASYTFTITGSRSLTANFKQKLKLWVGVNGKARKGVALYVGVNGKARKAVGAWIGVNGKARKFL